MHKLLHQQQRPLRGIVTALTDSAVILETGTGTAPTSSPACAGCGMCNASASPPRQRIRLRRRDCPPGIATGQLLCVTRTHLNPALAALLLFLFPLLSAATTAALLTAGGDAGWESGKGAGVVAGALIAGFFPAWVVEQLFSRRYPPVCTPVDKG